MTIDELKGIFIAYEIREGKNEPSRKEATFKVSKEPKKYETPSKNHSESSLMKNIYSSRNLREVLESIKESYL